MLPANKAAPVILVCEHASSHIPEKFHDLGLSEEVRLSHVAWDPGAELVTRAMSEMLNAPAVMSQTSRLVYDCNRPPGAPSAFPSKSEVFDIPGNQNLSDEQAAERVDTYYRPFEAALRTQIAAHQVPPAIVTIHSFTPIYHGEQRQVQLGILHDVDARLADAMLAIAPSHTDLIVQRNQPYGPEHGVTHTLQVHGIENGLLNVMIEIRNDLIQNPSQCAAMGKLLGKIVLDALAICKDSAETKQGNTFK